MTTPKNSGLITSWDDGHPLDLRVAELLDKYKVLGIFYIPITNPERCVMTKSQIRELSKKFEIGGHTYSHADLTSISLKEAQKEIERGKNELEDILGKKIDKFCYPKGKFNDDIKKIVRKSGFKEARTARIIFTGKSTDPFEKNPNLHFYEHLLVTYYAHCIKNFDLQTILALHKIKYGGIIDIANGLPVSELHIWGHSWELEEARLWKKFERILQCFNK